MERNVWVRSSTAPQGAEVHVPEVMMTDTEVLVRRSNDPATEILRYTYAEWEAALDGMAKGEFDLDPDAFSDAA